VSTYKTRLKQFRAAERSVPICLRGDLVAEWEEADRALKRLQDQPDDSLEGAGTQPLVERIEALQAQMSEHTDNFRVRALGGPKFRALRNAHPPRRGEDGNPLEEDAALGVNRETFYPALLRAAVVEPALDDDDWRELFGDDDAERARREAAGEPVEDGLLTDYQFQELAYTAWVLNAGAIDVPFSRAASFVKKRSGSE
jgi:hypothetical protein